MKRILIFCFMINSAFADDFAVGELRKVISSWSNSGLTAEVNEILIIARITADGGVRFTRSDGTSIWSNSDQAHNKTEEYYEPNFAFDFIHVGMWVKILQDIPAQNLLAGQSWQIIYIGSGRTGAQLTNNQWIGNNGKGLKWEFTEEAEFFFTDLMVGALVQGIGGGSIPTNQYAVITNFISPEQVVLHDGTQLLASNFMQTWRVTAWFNTTNLPDRIKITPDEGILQNLEEEWYISKSHIIVNDELQEVNVPIYTNPNQPGTTALIYFEQDSAAGDTYSFDFGGGVELRKSTWYFMLSPSNAYGPDHPYYRAGLLLGKILNVDGAYGGSMRHDPRGQYAVEFYLPDTGGGWTANHYGGWIEVSSPDPDFPPSNPIVKDQFNNEYKGWLVERNYLAEIPYIFPPSEDSDTTQWSRQDWASYYKSQYNIFNAQWDQPWVYENMGGAWMTGGINISRNPDPHIMNVKVIYNIKSAEPQNLDYYYVAPVQMFVSGGVMNTGNIKSGNYLIQIEDFELIFVEDHSISGPMVHNMGRVEVNSGSPELISVDQTSFKTNTGRIVQFRTNLNKVLAMKGFNSAGEKYYEGTWSDWIRVRTKYAVYSEVSGDRLASNLFDFDRWTLAHENFSITNR